MSHPVNDMIMESIGDDVAELTTTQIADELGLAVDALTLKPFADTPPPTFIEIVILESNVHPLLSETVTV